MFNYIWPIVLVVLANVVYQICTKSVPESVNPFASLAVTYTVGAICSVAVYFLTSKHTEPLKELSKMNWTSYVLGLVVVGLDNCKFEIIIGEHKWLKRTKKISMLC